MTLRAYLTQKLRGYYDKILSYADATIEDPADTENLHQFRVNTRRAKTILKEFEDCFEPEYLQKAKSTLGDFIKMSNEARDIDVFIQRIKEYPLPEGMSLDELKAVLQEMRLSVYDTLFGDLAKVSALLYALQEPRFEACEEDVDEELKRRFSKRLDRIRKLGPVIESDEEFHALRIAIKRARYMAELMVERNLLKKQRLKKLKALQDRFGEIQDTAVETKKLFDLANAISFAPSTVMAMGKMAGDLIERKERLKRKLKGSLKKRLKKIGA